MAEIEQCETRFLIIEDNPRYKTLLQESLEDYAYKHFSFAETTKQADDLLSKDYFDVIIADMRLGEEVDGGFTILNEIKTRTITSIVIILTANDSVIDCRRAFREGAWDYISKNMRGDVFKVLALSIADALSYVIQWGNNKDEPWIKIHQNELWEQYPDQYIAVLNNRVIDADIDYAVLEQRIRDNNRPLLIPIIKQMKVEKLNQLPIHVLIQRGENECLEFKSTLQCNIKDGSKNENVVLASLKTIAAFLNTSGGILLIGVEDDGGVFGLEADITLLGKRASLDGFEQKLTSYIVDRIGTAFSQFISIRFEQLSQKDICVVDVEKAKEPTFVQAINKNGGRQKYFYVRVGCTTRALDMEEMYKHFQMKMSGPLQARVSSN